MLVHLDERFIEVTRKAQVSHDRSIVEAGDTESVSQSFSIKEANKIVDDLRELLNLQPGWRKRN